jgi:predicted hotdog family 3-hydroxylacyl-ACP dehydratase
VKRMGIVLGVAALMAAIMALAAGTALAQAETETFHNTGTFTFTVENPCTGEEVLFEGKFNNPALHKYSRLHRNYKVCTKICVRLWEPLALLR